MQIAFLSDIHANRIAFETVLRDLDRKKPDRVVFLGDAATLGPDPSGVMRLLRTLAPTCILGNHDSYLLDPASAPEINWVSSWYREQLSDEDMDTLRTFQPRACIELEGGLRISCYHGSPKSFNDQILPTTPAETLETYLNGSNSQVYIGGHTHIQMMKQFRGKTIVNAGAVGQPFEYVPFSMKDGPRFLPWAEYTLLHWDGIQTGIELRRLPLDKAEMARQYAESSMPDPQYWFSLWLFP